MRADYYIIETLEIELNRLKYEDRTLIYFSARNENNEANRARWGRMHALDKAIKYLRKLADSKRYWKDGNEFNEPERHWPE